MIGQGNNEKEFLLMIDRSLILDDFENTAERLERKSYPRESLQEVYNCLMRRKELVRETDSLRMEMNQKSKSIGQLYQTGKKDDADQLKSEVAVLKEKLAILDIELKEVDAKSEDFLLRVPNLPDDRCPIGKDESANVVVKVVHSVGP